MLMLLFALVAKPSQLPVPCHRAVAAQQVARNNDLENMHLLEAADEWPFLREVVGKAGGDEAGEEEGKQEHLLCDALVGEPFYYRVSGATVLLPLMFCVCACVVPVIIVGDAGRPYMKTA